MNIIFDNAQSVREVCAGKYKTEAALQAAAIAAIAAVVATGQVFQATVSVTGYSGQDVNNVMSALNDGFFTTVLTGSSLVISW